MSNPNGFDANYAIEDEATRFIFSIPLEIDWLSFATLKKETATHERVVEVILPNSLQ